MRMHPIYTSTKTELAAGAALIAGHLLITAIAKKRFGRFDYRPTAFAVSGVTMLFAFRWWTRKHFSGLLNVENIDQMFEKECDKPFTCEGFPGARYWVTESRRKYFDFVGNVYAAFKPLQAIEDGITKGDKALFIETNCPKAEDIEKLWNALCEEDVDKAESHAKLIIEQNKKLKYLGVENIWLNDNQNVVFVNLLHKLDAPHDESVLLEELPKVLLEKVKDQVDEDLYKKSVESRKYDDLTKEKITEWHAGKGITDNSPLPLDGISEAAAGLVEEINGELAKADTSRLLRKQRRVDIDKPIRDISSAVKELRKKGLIYEAMGRSGKTMIQC